MPVIEDIKALKDEAAGWRQSLHQNPQTAYEETFASSLVAEKLTEWGIPFKANIAETGIVATIEGQNTDSGKTIGLRADMDALDVEEKTGLPHASCNHGKMHACGHDGHTATLLSATKYLSQNKNFNGTVHLIFQPAEEGRKGAHRMMEEGLFEDFPCDYVFGLHNWPWLPLGQMATRVGPLMAAVDSFEITVKGKGGHAAIPENTSDSIVIASHLVTALQAIVSRNVNPVETAVLSITNMNAGTGAFNIIGNAATLSGTVRSFRPEVRALVRWRMEETVQGVCAAFGAEGELVYDELIDPTINTADGVDLAARAAAAVVGPENVETDFPPTLAGEDFGAFLAKRPGAFLYLGQGLPEDSDSPHSQPLHSAHYDFNDDALPVGASWFVKLVEEYLS